MGVDCTCRLPGHRQIHHQVDMGETLKDDVRAGALSLSLAQRMKGRFDVGVGLLQLGGFDMGGRQPSVPGQWRGKPLNCVSSLTVADGGERAGRRSRSSMGSAGEEQAAEKAEAQPAMS